MAASKQANNIWYLDFGATNHVTANLGNLSLHSDYSSNDSVAVGNGKGLPISHIGSTTFTHDSKILHFKDSLHVSSISKNLLSV